MFEQSYSFGFEAAHELAESVGDPDHDYAHIHGHSFEVTVTLFARTTGAAGWVTDFAAVRSACAGIQSRLDHRLLNRIDGLERPTLENLCVFIHDALKPDLPAIGAVCVARPSLGERVVYRTRSGKD